MANITRAMNHGDTATIKTGVCPQGSTAVNHSIFLNPGDTFTATVAACATTPAPPSGDDAVGGDRITSGFWNNWRVRDDAKFTEVGGHGAMGTNTQGVRYIGGVGSTGSYRFKVKPTHASQINVTDRGGQHLGGIASYGLVFAPSHDAVRANSTRIDLDQMRDGSIRVHPYLFKNGVLTEPVFRANVAGLALNSWATIELKWERISSTQLRLTLNGTSQTITVASDAPNPSRYIALGNLDGITGAPEFDAITFT